MFLPTDSFRYISITKTGDFIILEQKFKNDTNTLNFFTLPNEEYSDILSKFNGSKIAFSITAAIFVVFFIIFLYAIYRLIFVYKRSPYVPFLVTIFVIDCIVMVIIILDNLVFIEWKHMCCMKFMALNFAYVSNMWLMAGMYFQRYIFIYHPMLKFHRSYFWKFFINTKILIFIGIGFGALHMGVSSPRKWNLASPVSIFEDTIFVCNNAVNNLRSTYDYVRYSLCNLLSYITPVIIDISLNVSVIFYKTDDKKAFFNKNSSQKSDSSKNTIETNENAMAAKRRREKRIFICLIVVTIQLILYIPILVCAFILTFLHLKVTPFIAAISFFLMYPYKLVVAHLLCRDYKSNPKQQQINEQQQTDTTSLTSLVNNKV